MRKIVLFALLAAVPFAAAGSLTTTFNSNNNFAGNMFDLTVKSALPLEITSFDVNIELPGTQQKVSVYWREGTYVGHENSPAGWTEMGTASATSAGQDNPTKVGIGGLVMDPGKTYGLYVFMTDYTVNPPPAGVAHMYYTNGPLGAFENDDLRFENRGVGKGSPPFTGSTFSPRIWNGTIYYDVIPEPATLALLGLALVFRRR